MSTSDRRGRLSERRAGALPLQRRRRRQPMNPEQQRRDDTGADWKQWGPYLAERAWGTVREDYSDHGDAWEHFPHDHARSRAFRWSEDGLGAISDSQQRLCFSFAFWNGQDPILKERIFGLTGNEGNHGEDAKEYWWYLDSTPTHSWMRWRYMYPQCEFPYEELARENRARGRNDPEFELNDTNAFADDRYFEITADYAKADVDDWCIEMRIRNAGPEAAPLHVLPTLWFRNTWSWGLDDRRPVLTATGLRLIAEHAELGRMQLSCESAAATAVTCENESNDARQLELARPDLVPRELSRHRSGPQVRPLLRRRPPRRVSDRLGQHDHPHARRRRDLRSTDRPLSK